MSSIDQESLDIFHEEAGELLIQIEESLLELEQSPEDPEVLNKVFRAFHTIKGSGAMFGFHRISAFAHKIESILDKVRKKEIPVSRQLIDLVLASRDFIQEMFQESDGRGKADPEKETSILRGLEAISHLELIQPPALDSLEKAAGAERWKKIFSIRFIPDPGILLRCLDPLDIFRELQRLGELVVHTLTDKLPSLDDLEVDRCYLEYDLLLTTVAEEKAIRDVFLFVEEDSLVEIREITGERSALLEDARYKKLGEILTEREDIKKEQLDKILEVQKKARCKTGDLLVESGFVSQEKVAAALDEQKTVRKMRESKQSNTVRVSAERLDLLINVVGELVTTQARLLDTAKKFNDQELMRPVEDMERLSTELRDSVLSIRMMPIHNTFNKFKRLVRDLSGNLGKRVRLELKGGETELDKTVIERIDEPLVHLIRNSVDHGIEPPEVRRQRDKPPEGLISLSAAHVGGAVQITLSDDGAGIDPEAVFQKAVGLELVGEQDNLSHQEKLDLIFHPGLSTVKQVSDVSGRGVGMDVVKSEVIRLQGSIEVESEKGRGTRLVIKLPLTLAIIDGLLVESDREKYVIPLVNIKECVEITDKEIESGHGCNVVRVREDLIPYVRLKKFFFEGERERDIEQMVVVEYDNDWAGIVIDHIYGDYQTVIKSLGREYAKTEGVSGATILGDGNVALIIDVPKLIEIAISDEAGLFLQ